MANSAFKPLSPQELKKVEQALRQQIADTSQMIREHQKNWAEGFSGIHQEDGAAHASETADQDMKTSNVLRLEKQLTALNRALARLQQAPNTFGECLRCRDNIEVGRLEIIPQAMLCTSCCKGETKPR